MKWFVLVFVTLFFLSINAGSVVSAAPCDNPGGVGPDSTINDIFGATECCYGPPGADRYTLCPEDPTANCCTTNLECGGGTCTGPNDNAGCRQPSTCDVAPPDTFPPIITSIVSPPPALAAGTTSTILQITTDEDSVCRWSTVSQGYNAMPPANAMTPSGGGRTHTVTLTGLSDGTAYNNYVSCVDVLNNAMGSNTLVSFSVSMPAAPNVGGITLNPDTPMPGGTTSTLISTSTTIAATCRWNPTLVPYASMPIANTFSTTGGTSHSTTYSGMTNGGTYTVYVRCFGNGQESNSRTRTFTVNNPIEPLFTTITTPIASQTFSAGTTNTFFDGTTNEAATCKWSLNTDNAYAAMNPFTTLTGGTTQRTTIPGLSNGQTYTVYSKCMNGGGTIMTTSASRTFSVANPGAPICCSGGSTVGCPAGTDVCALVTSTSCGTGRECLDLDKCGGSQDLVPNPYQLSNPPNYYNPGAPATFTCQAQCTDIIRRDITGACVRDGTCRGDALGMCSPGQGCCGVTGGDPYNDGVCRTAPAPTAALRPTTAPQGAPCAWNDEPTRGSVVCGGGTYVNTAQYQRPVCALNTLGQPTLLEEQFGTITTILPSGAQPTITTYTIVQQEITYPGVIPLCNGPNAYTLNTISCPSGYTQESTQNIDLGYCADETIGYFDGTEQPITGNSIVCSRTIPVASQGTATPYTITNTPQGCQLNEETQTCAPGYSITATTTTFSDPAYCLIMGTIVALPQITSTITCTPTPVVGCGNGVCDWTESGDSAAGNYCKEDCTTTTYGASAQCPNNAPAWNAAQGRCETPQCGETGTTGINCATLTAPATTGYYCSQGRNNVLAPQSYCCPQGTFWNPGTNSCQGSAQCYAAPCPYQPPNPLYFTTPACVSTSANAGNPGACCSVGMKDSIIPAYDYSDANGVTVNNFVVY